MVQFGVAHTIKSSTQADEVGDGCTRAPSIAILDGQCDAMLKAFLFVRVSEREKRLYRSLDTKAVVSQEDLLHRRGDERPNTGMREGLIITRK